MEKFKSKKVFKAIGYGLLEDMFCENDFSICKNTFNRKFKMATFHNVMKVDHEVRKEWRKHELICN